MSGPTLIELGKSWLPSMRYDTSHTDCTSYNMSIAPTAIVMERNSNGLTVKETSPGFRWDATFNIRYGNVGIRLHSDDGDKQLKRFKKKLVTLRNAIQTFLKECQRRVAHPADHDLKFEREWLNELTPETPFTGYFFYEIHPNGGGKFFIADCVRAINIWVDYYTTYGDEETQRIAAEVIKEKWAWLDALATQLDAAIDAIKTLNGRHRNGELINKLPKNSDKVVITK